MAFSVAEDELRSMDTEFLAGHLAAWNYFQSIETPDNLQFVENFKNYCKTNNLPGKDARVTDDPVCWSYTGLYLWKAAVEKAGSGTTMSSVSHIISNCPSALIFPIKAFLAR